MPTATPPLTDLLDHYALPRPDWCRANAVATLSGHVTGPDGVSGSINSEGDHAVFTAIRTLTDVVVVSAGTARAEGYRRLRSPAEAIPHRRAAGRTDHPTLAVVTTSGQLPERLLEPSDPASSDLEPSNPASSNPERPGTADPRSGELIVLCTEQTPAPRRRDLAHRLGEGSVLTLGADRVDPERARAALTARGLSSVLCEGGPSLYAAWVEAGVIDELCLTLRPLLMLGAGPRLLESGAAGDAHPRHLATGTPPAVLPIGPDLMLRYRLTAAR